MLLLEILMTSCKLTEMEARRLIFDTQIKICKDPLNAREIITGNLTSDIAFALDVRDILNFET